MLKEEETARGREESIAEKDTQSSYLRTIVNNRGYVVILSSGRVSFLLHKDFVEVLMLCLTKT